MNLDLEHLLHRDVLLYFHREYVEATGMKWSRYRVYGIDRKVNRICVKYYQESTDKHPSSKMLWYDLNLIAMIEVL